MNENIIYNSDQLKFRNAFRVLGIIVFSGIILKVGSPLFIPLSFALFIGFILQPFCAILEKKRVGRVPAIIIGLLLLTVLFGSLLYIMYLQFRSFTGEWAFVNTKLKELLITIKLFLTYDLGFPKEQVETWFTSLVNSIGGNTIRMIETTMVNVFVNVVMLLLIPIYAFLILYYRKLLVDVLYSLFPAPQRQKVSEVLVLSIQTYYNFVKGMALVYFIVGVLNSLGLFLLGVPHPILFGFLTAIMTFIPYIGIMVASLLPITYAWITYDSVWFSLGVIAIFAFVQYLEANIIFPWAVGHKLKLNTLITLIIIIAGGIIWGAAGMILFIPFAAILKLIADRMEGWETISKFLGGEN